MATADPAAPAPAKRSRTLLFVGLAVLIVAAVAAGAFVLLGDDDDESSSSAQGSAIEFPNGQVVPLFGNAPAAAPKKEWRTELDCNAQCQVTVDDKLVFTTQEKNGKHRVEAFDAATGKSAWKNTKIDPGEYGVYLQRYGDLLLVSTQTDDVGAHLVALEPSTGKQLWKSTGSWSGLVEGDKLIVSRSDGEDRASAAVRASSGEDAWTSEGDAVGACSGKVMLAREREVAVVDGESGERAWQVPAASPDDATCARDRAYVLTGGGVTAYDIDSGSRAWRSTVRGADGVAGADDLVVVAGSDGWVAFEAAGGKERWRASKAKVGDNDAILLPVGGGKALTFSDETESLVSLDDGTIGKPAPGPDVGAPAEDALVYIDADDDTMHALSLKTLEKMWKGPKVEHADDLSVAGGRVFVLSDDGVTAFA